MASQIVAGELEQYFDLDGQLHEIKRQLRQVNGYPFNALRLRKALQEIIEGKFYNQFVAPLSGDVCVLNVLVNEYSPWHDAIRDVAPNTSASDNIWNVGNLYQPVNTGVKNTKIILVNFGHLGGGSLRAANDWAKKYNLKQANPRHIFAVARYRPLLAYELVGGGEVCLVETKGCTFGKYQVCGIDWDDSSPLTAHLTPTGPEGCYYIRTWFAFYEE